MKTIKNSFLVVSILILTSCADAIFEIQLNNNTSECLNFETNGEPIKLYAYNGENRIDEIIIGDEKIKGYFKYHPIQVEKGNPIEFPNFSIFESNECRIVLEHKEMNNKLFVVDDERVNSFFEQKAKTGDNTK